MRGKVWNIGSMYEKKGIFILKLTGIKLLDFFFNQTGNIIRWNEPNLQNTGKNTQKRLNVWAKNEEKKMYVNLHNFQNVHNKMQTDYKQGQIYLQKNGKLKTKKLLTIRKKKPNLLKK